MNPFCCAAALMLERCVNDSLRASDFGLTTVLDERHGTRNSQRDGSHPAASPGRLGLDSFRATYVS